MPSPRVEVEADGTEMGEVAAPAGETAIGMNTTREIRCEKVA